MLVEVLVSVLLVAVGISLVQHIMAQISNPFPGCEFGHVVDKINNVYISGNCFFNVKEGVKILRKEFPKKTFTIVYGAMGFGLGDKIHWEYGFNPEKKNIKSYVNPFGQLDAHAWIVDEEGRIFDVFFQWYFTCCEMWGVEVGFEAPTFIATSPENLKEFGIHYLPASRWMHGEIRRFVKKNYLKIPHKVGRRRKYGKGSSHSCKIVKDANGVLLSFLYLFFLKFPEHLLFIFYVLCFCDRTGAPPNRMNKTDIWVDKHFK